MSLKDTEIRAIRATDKPVRKADGKGLYVEAFPNGSKLWRLKYRFAGKEKRLALGSYPEIGLAEARKRRDAARATLEQGIDPGLKRKQEKAATKVSAVNNVVASILLVFNATFDEGTPIGTSACPIFLSFLRAAEDNRALWS